jgi:hypothetical protein
MELMGSSNKPKIILDTEQEKNLAASYAPGLAKIELPYVLTEIGSSVFRSQLQMLERNPKSPYHADALISLGEYATKLAAMKESDKKEST